MSTIGAPLPNRESLINYLFSRWLIEPAGWRLMGAINNRFRQETLDLPAQTIQDHWQGMRRMLVVQGFSSHVVPHPRGLPANIHTAGYWFLDEDRVWQPPAALLDFLTGAPPSWGARFGRRTASARRWR
jgi:hypothetical protein